MYFVMISMMMIMTRMKVTTSKVNHDITPGKRQRHECEESNEDDKDESWRLLFRPQEDGMDVIPEQLFQTIIKDDTVAYVDD